MLHAILLAMLTAGSLSVPVAANHAIEGPGRGRRPDLPTVGGRSRSPTAS